MFPAELLIRLIVMAAAAAGASAPAAPLWSPPSAGYALELPSGWAEGPAMEEGSAVLLGPGKTQGFRPLIGIVYHEEVASRIRERREMGFERYLNRIKSPPGRAGSAFRSSSLPSLIVGGRKAQRVRTSEKRRFRAEDGVEGGVPPDLDIVVRRDYVVIPGEGGFHVLTYSASAEDFAAGLPAFERVLKTFRFLEARP